MTIPTIYLADDDADDRLVFARALERCGGHHVLRCAENGEELLAALCEAAAVPELIILDLNMPLRNGRETAHTVRENPRFSGTPLVVLTTSEAALDRQWSLETGIDGYYVKPSSFHALEAIVRTMVDRFCGGACPLRETRPPEPALIASSLSR